jgi:hypothetical protein
LFHIDVVIIDVNCDHILNTKLQEFSRRHITEPFPYSVFNTDGYYKVLETFEAFVIKMSFHHNMAILSLRSVCLAIMFLLSSVKLPLDILKDPNCIIYGLFICDIEDGGLSLVTAVLRTRTSMADRTKLSLGRGAQ